MIIITKYCLGFCLCGSMLDFTSLISWKLSSPGGNHSRGVNATFSFFLCSVSFRMDPVYAYGVPGPVSSIFSQECLLLCSHGFLPHQVQHNRVDSAFHKSFLDTFANHDYSFCKCLSQLQKFFLMTDCSFIFILFQ